MSWLRSWRTSTMPGRQLRCTAVWLAWSSSVYPCTPDPAQLFSTLICRAADAGSTFPRAMVRLSHSCVVARLRETWALDSRILLRLPHCSARVASL